MVSTLHRRRSGLLILAKPRHVLRVTVDREISFRTVKYVADGIAGFLGAPVVRVFDTGFMVADPVPDIEHHHPLLAAVVELVVAGNGVRRFLIVVEYEMPADGADRGGIPHAQAPSRNVHFVNALIAQVAIAVFPEPVPVVVEAVPGKRSVRRYRLQVCN